MVFSSNDTSFLKPNSRESYESGIVKIVYILMYTFFKATWLHILGMPLTSVIAESVSKMKISGWIEDIWHCNVEQVRTCIVERITYNYNDWLLAFVRGIHR